MISNVGSGNDLIRSSAVTVMVLVDGSEPPSGPWCSAIYIAKLNIYLFTIPAILERTK